MTETTTESPAILKREALRLMGLPVDGDWPESVTPGELAAIQYPSNRATPKEVKSLLRQKQADLAALATAAIDAGELPTVPAVRQVSALVKAIETRNSWVMGGPRRVTRLVRAPVDSREVQAIERDPCRTWLDAIGKPPGEYVRAWLGDECPEPAKAATIKPERATERRDRLAVAIGAALIALRGKLKSEPTAGDVFDYLADHDETGIIEDCNDSFLWWKTSKGGSKKTSRKALENRLTGIKRKSPA